MRPLLALTPGEPAGIGPDLCIALAQAGLAANIVVIADPELLRQRALLLQLPLLWLLLRLLWLQLLLLLVGLPRAHVLKFLVR